MKKVVLVNQSSGYLMTDIANAYAEQYDEVVMMAGNIVPNERKLDGKVKVNKIMGYDRTSSIKRLATWVWGTVQIFCKLLCKYKQWKVVYVTNPPLAYLCAGCLKNPFSIIVYDTYPDALANIGIRKGNFLYNWWAKKNRKLFAKAEKVFTLSEGMASQLETYTERNKIKVIPNWSAQDGLKPIVKKENPFVKEHGLEDKFVVMYSGNIGLTHNVEVITELAELLRDNDNIRFIVIGEGKKKESLMEEAKKKELTNCEFMTWQAHDVMPFSLASADLAIVTLNNETGMLSVPSKTYNLLAVGAPLLCVTPYGSEIERLVTKYGNGECFMREELEGMKAFILKMVNDKNLCGRLSKKSTVASEDFDYKRNAREYVI